MNPDEYKRTTMVVEFNNRPLIREFSEALRGLGADRMLRTYAALIFEITEPGQDGLTYTLIVRDGPRLKRTGVSE